MRCEICGTKTSGTGRWAQKICPSCQDKADNLATVRGLPFETAVQILKDLASVGVKVQVGRRP